MLPALRRQKEVSISAPAEHIKREPDEGAEYDVLESAAEDLCKAIHSNDYKGAAVALRAAFDLMESQPHEEAPDV